MGGQGAYVGMIKVLLERDVMQPIVGLGEGEAHEELRPGGREGVEADVELLRDVADEHVSLAVVHCASNKYVVSFAALNDVNRDTTRKSTRRTYRRG